MTFCCSQNDFDQFLVSAPSFLTVKSVNHAFFLQSSSCRKEGVVWEGEIVMASFPSPPLTANYICCCQPFLTSPLGFSLPSCPGSLSSSSVVSPFGVGHRFWLQRQKAQMSCNHLTCHMTRSVTVSQQLYCVAASTNKEIIIPSSCELCERGMLP